VRKKTVGMAVFLEESFLRFIQLRRISCKRYGYEAPEIHPKRSVSPARVLEKAVSSV
jgi:hypothetical protein